MDWKNTTYGQQGSSSSVPDSCCLTDADGCGTGILDETPEDVSSKKIKLLVGIDVCGKNDFNYLNLSQQYYTNCLLQILGWQSGLHNRM